MKNKTSRRQRLAALARTASQWGVALGALCATRLALAVNDLPGGPAVNQLDLHPPVTRIAHEQQWLHNFMMLICLVIFVGVFGVMFYSIFKHRKSKGAQGGATSTRARRSRSSGPSCRSSS